MKSPPGKPARSDSRGPKRNADPGASTSLSAIQLRIFRILTAVVLPLLAIGGTEAALRLGGYGYPPGFFQRVTIEGEPCLAENPKFGYRFFPPRLARMPTPVTMRAAKTPGTVRIFVLGESAALGDPRPHFGASRYMETLLRLKFPARDFEVINTSTTAINSHVIREIAKACAAQEGDIWLLYMGNNEMVGPFGAATVFGQQAPPLWVIRALVKLQEWRVGQLLAALARNLHKSDAEGAEWRGMEMFLRNLVPAGDPSRERVYESYRQNLAAIVRSGLGSGAKVILSTVAVNTRDCPPFAGIASNTLPAVDLAELEHLLRSGAGAERSNDWATAAGIYTSGTARYASVSELHYRLGRAHERLAQNDAARKHFGIARDVDALPFRADKRINQAVREVRSAADPKRVLLCDAETDLDLAAGGKGCGAEFFYEHVHLNFDGNYQLGLSWARAVEKLLPTTSETPGEQTWASRELCETRLGLTDWNRRSVLQEVIDRLKVPPLSSQSDNDSRLADLHRKLAMLEQNLPTQPPEAARELYRQAIAHAPADYRLRENYAEFLQETGDLAEEIVQRRKIRDLTPHFYFSHMLLGTALKRQKQFAEARTCLMKAAQLNPYQADIYVELGSVRALESDWEGALREFRRGLQLSPNQSRLHHLEGDVLWRLNRKPEAIQSLRRATNARGSYPEAHYRLGEMLALTGDVPGAAAEFAEVLRARPQHVKARVNLGVALGQLGKPAEAKQQFDLALQLDPGNDLAREYKARAEQELNSQ